ncbi:MAG: biotin--[acetyl-CoA-carboxylase] ligase [Phycisphaerales bacterium]|nr:biotin--[acetyl-CoA-carboxylase] ligase [Phycisphaerales bacterium]
MPTENPPAIPVERFHTIDSTSLEARRRLAAGTLNPPIALVAERQTGGVGRFKRPWESPIGGLWLTLAWPLGPNPAATLDGLGLRLGLAVARAVERVVQGAAPVALKWPNDVLVGGRKAAGILAEVVGDAALIGVGVNADFASSQLAPELQPRATTLRDATRRPIDLPSLEADLLRHLAGALRAEALDAPTLEAVRARLHGVGEPVSIRLPDGERRSGVFLGIGDDGRARLHIDGHDDAAPHGAELFIEPR